MVARSDHAAVTSAIANHHRDATTHDHLHPLGKGHDDMSMRAMRIRLLPVKHDHYCEHGDHRWVCDEDRCIKHSAVPCAVPCNYAETKGKIPLTQQAGRAILDIQDKL
jgi:hypothetical protein